MFLRTSTHRLPAFHNDTAMNKTPLCANVKTRINKNKKKRALH